MIACPDPTSDNLAMASRIPARLKVLVAVHAAIATGPVFAYFLPARTIAGLNALLLSLPFASLIVLCFWGGLWPIALWRRVLATLVAVQYLSGLNAASSLFAGGRDWALANYVHNVTWNTVFVAVVAGSCGLLRFLQFRLSEGGWAGVPVRRQYSLLHLFGACSAIAFCLSAATYTSGPASTVLWIAFGVVIVLTAIWSTLYVDRIIVACLFYLVLAFGLGTIQYVIQPMVAGVTIWQVGATMWENWRVPLEAGVVYVVCPSVLVLLSLLVVRSAGYRLVKVAGRS